MTDSWHSYPKLFAIGHRAVAEIFTEDVIVEEKIDGSQFSFGRFDGRLRLRSRGKQFDLDNCEKMFKLGAEAVSKLDLKDGYTYRGEYLAKPKHNTLCYDRTPDNYVIIFDINDDNESYLSYEDKRIEAQRLSLEVVPILFQGKIESADQVKELMASTSCLGGVTPEGIVIKNYKRFGVDGKALMAKYVTEAFKEVHRSDWDARHPSNGDILEAIGQTYLATARWDKAVQRLRDNGDLRGEPADIGPLMKEVPEDILSECEAEIKDKLFAWAWPQIKRMTVRGLPEWYKDRLLSSQFNQGPK